MWYAAGNAGWITHWFGYATSKDGVHWDKPVLEDIEGRRKELEGSNVCLDISHHDSSTVWLDHSAGDPGARFKFKLRVDGDPKKTKWVLVNGKGGYMIGDFDGTSFSPGGGRGRTVSGPIYGTQTFGNAPDGLLRRIQMSWLRIGPRGAPFRQMISLPVELTLRTTDKGVQLFAEPAREIEGLRTEMRTYPDADLASAPLRITDLPWELMDIELTVDLAGAARVEFGVWGHRLRYGEGRRARPVPADGKLKLRILVDRGVIDICEQDGRAFLMAGLQADRRKPAFEASSEGGRAVIRDLKIRRLKSVWGNE